MTRFLGFGLILALAIITVSCHQTGFPHGGITYADLSGGTSGGGGVGEGFLPPFPPIGDGGIPGGNIPGWETGSPSNPGGRMTVAEQFDWLRANAAAGSRFNVWAWQEPNERLYDQDIHGIGGVAISVLMQSYYAQTRVLQLGEGGDTMFTMGNNSTLYIQNLELQGLSTNNAALVRVDDDGKFFMGIFSAVKYSEIGVAIVDGGHLIMTRNSEINSNRFYGVHMTGSRSKFEMRYDSSISSTVAVLRRGVRVNGGEMIMNGRSTVTSNTHGDGILLVNGGRLIMNYRSSISGNNRGIWVAGSTSTVVMNDYAAIYNNTNTNGEGAGVVVTEGATLIMNNNSRIRHNESRVQGRVGGVVVDTGSTLIMNQDARIHNNSCAYGGPPTRRFHGGGVSVRLGTVQMNGNSRIENNRSMNHTNSGGGVDLLDNASLIMNGNSRISGNHSRPAGGGGGVRVGNNSTVTINGGLIYGNNHDNPSEINTVAAASSHVLFITGSGNVRVGGISGTLIDTSRDNTIGVHLGVQQTGI